MRRFMYFKKVSDDFDYNQYNCGVITNFYGKDKKGLTYYRIDNSNDHLFNYIKKPYRKHFTISLLDINIPFVSPHTDSNIQVSINFYIQTNICKTSFYKFNNTNFSERKIPNQTNGSVFDLKDLTEVDSFIAKNKQVYVLDVSQPHSVAALSITRNSRIVICLQTNFLTYQETLSVLNF
jgi:hypothetical protein